jgi:regulation of enolase protein 1 (concanavalin A-like superfamily)
MKEKHFLLTGVMLLLSMFTWLRAQNFTHPNIPLSANDLSILKAHIQANEQPWKAAYDMLAADGHSSLSYTMQGPFASVSRNPNINLTQWRNDMVAVWNLSLMWYFTGNTSYATKARDILIAWANTQTEFVGMEANLDLGDYAYAFAGGASILRGTWSGWTSANTTTVKNLFNNVYWPATGCGGYALGPANKGTLSMAAGAAIAAFSDDASKVSKIIYLMQTSASSGFLNTLPIGEVGESARDQGHAAGDWGSLVFAAEVLWKQGIDVYSYLDNRLFAAAEYFARKNEGLGVPYVPFGTTDYYYLTDATEIWNGGHWFLNMAHGHYVIRKGMSSEMLRKRHLGELVNIRNTFFYKSSDNSTASLPSTPAFATSALVGTGLTNIDIGGATPTGSGTFSNNVWTVSGGGTDLWTHNADAFHFLYKQVTGNCVIIARVNSVGGSVSGNKAGVMIRNDLTSTSSQRAWMAITGATMGEAFLHGYTEVRGGSNWEKFSRAIPQVPYWVKIERIGDVIACYYSPDGTSWAVEVEGRFENWTGTAYLGLVVSSATNGTAITSTFSNVSITGGSGGVVTTPVAPAAIIAQPGNNKITVRWLPSFGATSYKILRSTSSGGTYSEIASGVTGTSYVNQNIPNGQIYYYKVRAVNSVGTSSDSPTDNATASVPPIPSVLYGNYKIIASHSNKALDVKDGSTADGAQVIQWTDNGGTNQQWTITQISGDDYKIINVNSGKAMDVVNNSTSNGALIEQRTYSSSDNSQVWTINNNGNDTYRIIGKNSQKSLDIAGSSTADGATVALWTYGGGGNQSFKIVRAGTEVLTGTYKIIALSSNKLVEVTGGSTADGAAVEQWTDNGGTNQQWVITQVSGSDYTIVNVKSGKAMDVIGNATADGAKLEQRTLVSGETHQQWTITNNGDGTYKILGKASGKSLDVTSGSLVDGALMEIWPYSGGTNQKFILTKIKGGSIRAEIKEEKVSDLLFYPNPIVDALNIRLPEPICYKVEIYNISGRLMHSFVGIDNHVVVNMKNIPSGMYLVKVNNGQQIISKKIIKK